MTTHAASVPSEQQMAMKAEAYAAYIVGNAKADDRSLIANYGKRIAEKLTTPAQECQRFIPAFYRALRGSNYIRVANELRLLGDHQETKFENAVALAVYNMQVQQ